MTVPLFVVSSFTGGCFSLKANKTGKMLKFRTCIMVIRLSFSVPLAFYFQ